MVRSAGRSRGCRICRQRRIKCDETLPECTQCKRNGKKCPGPITGTFYIITSETVTWPSSSSSNSNHTIESPEYGHSPISESPTGSETLYSPPISAQSHISLPTTHQPSRTEAFTHLYFSHFFSTHSSGIETLQSCSWLAKLPLLMAKSNPSPSMTYSLRATSMAFYGLLNNSLSIQTEARRTYIKALQYRRKELARGGSEEGALCATVMMCYFELVVKTTPGAWMVHLDAAVSILERIGPENCQEGFVHQLFRTVRLGVAFASVVLEKPHVFAGERWRIVPFEKKGEKTQLDVLVDVVLDLPAFISHPSNTPEFLAGIYALISTLDTQSHSNLPQNNSFTACLAAIRNAAYLICCSLLGQDFKENRALAAEEVLRAVGSVDECVGNAPASSLFLTTVFAREVVCVWGQGMVTGR